MGSTIQRDANDESKQAIQNPRSGENCDLLQEYSSTTVSHPASVCSDKDIEINERYKRKSYTVQIEYQRSVLWTALFSGNVEMVDLLLRKGTMIDLRIGEREETALGVASRDGREQIVRTLLEKGADTEKADFFGRNPLHSAVRNGHQDIVRLLLGKGANVNVTDRSGYWPLIQAVVRLDEGLIRFLLEKGAKVDQKDASIGTALLELITIMKLLLIDGEDVNEDTPWFRIAKLLVDNGADVNEGTSLFDTLRCKHEGNIKLLVNTGANVNAVREFIEKGGIPSWVFLLPTVMLLGNWFREVFSITPEFRLRPIGRARSNKSRVLWTLTPLWLAAATESENSVRLLLEKGARMAEPRNSAMTPTQIITDQNHMRIVELLSAVSTGESSDSEIVESSGDFPVVAVREDGSRSCVDMVSWLHERKAGEDTATEDNEISEVERPVDKLLRYLQTLMVNHSVVGIDLFDTFRRPSRLIARHGGYFWRRGTE